MPFDSAQHLKSFNRIIITANPSFATDLEANFWKHFDRVCEREGWRLFKHSMRRIPEDPRTMILPARLSDVAGFLKFGPTDSTSEALPNWFSRENFDLIVEWEHKRWQLPEFEPKVPLGLCRLAWHVDRLFNRLKPAGVIVSNKIDHGTALFYWAALYYGSEPIFFERSPLETFIFEQRGMFAESEVWTRYPKEVLGNRADLIKTGMIHAKFLSANTDGFRKQDFSKNSDVSKFLAGLPKPIIFLPMDNILWTGWAQNNHWQGTVDHFKGTPNPVDSIRRIGEIASELGGSVVVKKHPSDVQSYDGINGPVHFVDAPIETLAKTADVTVAFLTKVAFVTAAMKRPTVVLAPNTVAAGPTCIFEKATAGWKQAILKALALDSDAIEKMWEELCALLGWLDRHFYLDPTLPADLSKPSSQDLFMRVLSSEAGLRAGLTASALDNLISETLGIFGQRREWMSNPKNGPKPIKVFYDVSRLANTRLAHSGISRFVSNTLALLRNDPEVKVIPFMSKPAMLDRGVFKGKPKDFSESIGGGLVDVSQIAAQASKEDSVYFSPYEELSDLPGIWLPRVATVHDVLHVTSSEWYLDPKLRAHIDAVLNSIAPQDNILTVSEFTRMQLLRVKNLDPEKVETVHLAAGHSFAPKAKSEVVRFLDLHGLRDRPYFVLFGQFEFRKNVATTLAAIRAYTQKHPSGASFVIVGSAVGTDAMRNAVARAGIDPSRTVFLSGPSDDELALAYSGAAGMLYISLAEGFGLPICEAMACGCPVVTSSITSIPEVAGDAALYVDPFNASEIAEAIATLAGSNSLAARLRSVALAKATQFSWDRTAAGIVRLSRNALARQSAAAANSEFGIVKSAASKAPVADANAQIIRASAAALVDPAAFAQRLSQDVAFRNSLLAARKALGDTHPHIRHFDKTLAHLKIASDGSALSDRPTAKSA